MHTLDLSHERIFLQSKATVQSECDSQEDNERSIYHSRLNEPDLRGSMLGNILLTRAREDLKASKEDNNGSSKQGKPALKQPYSFGSMNTSFAMNRLLIKGGKSNNS